MPSVPQPAFNTILHLMATHPGLVASHMQAYAELLASEARKAGQRWKRQTLLMVAAAFGLGVGTMLAGVAWMLFATGTPVWALLSAPLPPLLLGVVCLLMAQRPAGPEPFGELRRQWAADLAMLQETLAP